MSDLEDPVMGSDAGDDLFGDGDDDSLRNEGSSNKGRADSEDPDASDRDIEEDERYLRRDASEEQRPEETKVVLDLPLYRHTLPRTDDGEYRSLRVPPFIKIRPQKYDGDKFEPTEWDLENARNPRPKPVVRHRTNPSTGHPESNAHLHRWSDGSITLSIGDEQFEIQRKNLAPLPNTPYDQLKDAHYYAAAAHLSTNMLVTVGHVTEQFMVKPNQLVEDDGIAAFKRRMAKERAARQGPTVDAEAIKLTQVDPEQMKRAAELAERERAKAQRRRETAQARQGGYGGGGRYGGGGGGGGGLSVEGLEGGRGKGGARKRGAPGGGKPKKRRPEYDSDDEPGAPRRADNYDYDDGFLARSDEEVSEDGEEEEEDMIDEEEERPRKKRQKTVESEEDAEGEADDDAPAEHARNKRRNIIDDDDEE